MAGRRRGSPARAIHRAAEELRSALIFRALAQASARTPICAAWRQQFVAASHDEVFHAKLCAAIGAPTGAPLPVYDAGPVRARLAWSYPG